MLHRRTRWPGALLLSVFLPTAAGRSIPADEPASGIKDLSVRLDPRTKEVLYQPAYDTWTLYDLRFYPILRRATDGTRSLLLYVNIQGERRIGVKALDVDVEGVSQALPLKRSDVKADTSGCRVTETMLLEDQEELIRKLAGAREATVSAAGVLGTSRYRLSTEELAHFARIVDLYGSRTLPEPDERKPPTQNAREQGLKYPEVVRSSKVAPEFPVMARDRMARGKVTLHAVVREDGTTEVIDVMKSSARYCGFEQAAIDAVRQWRYTPGQKDGKPVDFYFTVDIDFVWR